MGRTNTDGVYWLVKDKDGKPVVKNTQLPMYWEKKRAQRAARAFEDSTVVAFKMYL